MVWDDRSQHCAIPARHKLSVKPSYNWCACQSYHICFFGQHTFPGPLRVGHTRDTYRRKFLHSIFSCVFISTDCVPVNNPLLLLQMHQGYVRDAERLNAQLEHYAADSRYQGMYIDLVCNAFYTIHLKPFCRAPLNCPRLPFSLKLSIANQ